MVLRVRGPAPFFAFAFLSRLTYLLVARPSFDGVYWALAGGLLRDGSLAIDGARRTDFEPLYPMVLAASRIVTREHLILVQILQIAIASAGAVFLYRLAIVLTGRPLVAALAA